MTSFTISLIGPMCIFAVGLSAQNPGAGGIGSQPTGLIQPGTEANTDSWRMVLTGNVTMDDGTPPPGLVMVKQMCAGQLKREVYADPKGRFTFGSSDTSGGAGTGANTDASAVGHGPIEDLGQGESLADMTERSVRRGLDGCELEAVLPGFVSRPLILNSRSLSGNSMVGTLILKPLTKGGGYTISATTLQAPSKALKSFEKGLAALNEKKWEAAEREFGKATELYPQFAVAWFELGVARSDALDNTGAEDAWKHSLQADPKYVKPYEPLIALSNMKHDWSRSEQLASQWIATDPEAFPEAYLVDALAWLMMNDPDKAEHAARESIRLDKLSQVSKSRYVLGYILAQKHRYPESAQYFREYLAMAPNAENAATVRQQLAQYEQAGIAAAKQP